MARKAILSIDKEKYLSQIDERIYGSFVEHLGRSVYTGIYQPDHPEADEDGFRRDVMDLVKELQVPIIRYPGGNFVSNFYWEDSVGPKNGRKKRLDLAWKSVEPNEFGLNEFSKWCRKVGAKPMMAVNLGTRGISDALNLLEYCNMDTDSYYANMRRQHGDKEPYGIKTWCMGNEMDAPWQYGSKTAEEYGRLANETAKAMKSMDPSIECILCGSSMIEMPSFPDWEHTTLVMAYDNIDYISLHQYFDNEDNDVADYLAKSDDLKSFIETVIHVCDEIKAKKRSSKTVNLSFDEWNVWYHSRPQDDLIRDAHPWETAQPYLEDIYNFEDALMVGECIINLLQHCDRIKIACLAQLVNVIAPIHTEKDGGAWKQTIYYPFCQASRYGRGKALKSDLKCSKHNTSKHTDVTDIEAIAVWNEEKEELTIFAVNRHPAESVSFSARINGFSDLSVVEYSVMKGYNMNDTNNAEAQLVVPQVESKYVLDGSIFQASFAPLSWNVIRLAAK